MEILNDSRINEVVELMKEETDNRQIYDHMIERINKLIQNEKYYDRIRIKEINEL